MGLLGLVHLVPSAVPRPQTGGSTSSVLTAMALSRGVVLQEHSISVTALTGTLPGLARLRSSMDLLQEPTSYKLRQLRVLPRLSPLVRWPQLARRVSQPLIRMS